MQYQWSGFMSLGFVLVEGGESTNRWVERVGERGGG